MISRGKFIECFAWIRTTGPSRKPDLSHDRILIRGAIHILMGSDSHEFHFSDDDKNDCEIWIDSPRRELLLTISGDASYILEHSCIVSAVVRQDLVVFSRPFAEFLFPHSICLRILPPASFSPSSFSADIEWARDVLVTSSVVSVDVSQQQQSTPAECFVKWAQFVRSLAIATSPEFLSEATHEAIQDQISKTIVLHAEMLHNSDICQKPTATDSYETHLLGDILLSHRNKAMQ